MMNALVGTQSIGKGMRNKLLTLALLALGMMLFASGAQAVQDNDHEDEFPFAEAEIYLELNNTDGDLGIHSLIDGDPWKRLTIEGPREREILNIFVQNRLRWQGLTEIFFESAEPTFDELSPEKFFKRFPQGEYEIEGATLKNKEINSIAELTHLLPAPPQNIMVNGTKLDEGCDDEEPTEVEASEAGLVITWDPVMKSHPELGITGKDILVEHYEVVLEQEDLGLVFTVELPPDVTSVQIPKAFTDLGEEFKLEILVREESHNQTAVETCFELDDDE